MKSSIYNTTSEEKFWTQRYENGSTGWNIGYASPPITAYFDQVPDKSARILIPGAGNAYEAEYLYQQGFENVFVLDIAQPPLDALKNAFRHSRRASCFTLISLNIRGSTITWWSRLFSVPFLPYPTTVTLTLNRCMNCFNPAVN